MSHQKPEDALDPQLPTRPESNQRYPSDADERLPSTGHAPPLASHLSQQFLAVPNVYYSCTRDGTAQRRLTLAEASDATTAANNVAAAASSSSSAANGSNPNLQQQQHSPGVITVTPIDLVSIVTAISECCAHISNGMRYHVVEKKHSTNEFGDEVLSIDELADKFICRRLSTVSSVRSISSEERPALQVLREGSNGCCITFDPLDGSSVIASNFSVGSIFCVWPGKTPVGLSVKDVLCSVVAVYGPRTTLFVAHAAFKGVFEYMLFNDRGDWGLAHRQPHRIAPKAKIFSPANLRCASESDAYFNWIVAQFRTCKDKNSSNASSNDGNSNNSKNANQINNSQRQKKPQPLTLRYTGGMVPDVTQSLIKGSGIFVTPYIAGTSFKRSLRMTFEVAPMGFMILCAGGAAHICEGEHLSLLDERVRVKQLDERTTIVCGSRETVAEVVEVLRRESRQKKKMSSSRLRSKL